MTKDEVKNKCEVVNDRCQLKDQISGNTFKYYMYDNSIYLEFFCSLHNTWLNTNPLNQNDNVFGLIRCSQSSKTLI